VSGWGSLVPTLAAPPTLDSQLAFAEVEPEADAKIRAMFDDAVIHEAGRRILGAAPPGARLILFATKH
jgi:hypothetical protein